MFRDGYKNAQVVTSDGKKLGTVKSLDSKSLVVFKKGLIRDEEFHIPINAVSHYRDLPLLLYSMATTSFV